MVLQRQCACGNHSHGEGECEECAKKKSKNGLQRKAAGASPARIPSSVRDVLRAPGAPLHDETRAFMEERFTRDFSRVRVHTNDRAAQSAAEVGANAYAVGNDVVFGADQYRPGTTSGIRLLAHELTHVAQQSIAGAAAPAASQISKPGDASEREADRIAARVMNGDLTSVRESPAAPLQRELSKAEKVGIGVGAVLGVGAGVAWLVGAFDSESFSDSDLREYLKALRDTRRIQGGTASDNKARACVRRERQLGPYSVEIKTLLVRQMLDGPTLGADESAIITLLRNATDAERQQIVAAIGRDNLWDDFSGRNRRIVEAVTLTAADAAGNALATRWRTLPAEHLQDYIDNAVDPDVRAAAQRAQVLTRITAPVPVDVAIGAGGEATFQINGANVTVLPDIRSNDEQFRDRAFTRVELNVEGELNAMSDPTTNTVASFNPLRVVVRIQTIFGPGVEPGGSAGYGRGTTEADKQRGQTSLRFHESRHAADWFEFLRTNPVPTFQGAVGMSVPDFQRAQDQLQTDINEYSRRAAEFSVRSTDCTGTLPTTAQLRPFGFTAAICHQRP